MAVLRVGMKGKCLEGRWIPASHRACGAIVEEGKMRASRFQERSHLLELGHKPVIDSPRA